MTPHPNLRWSTRDEAPASLPGVPTLDVWPEYNVHGDVVEPLWDRLLADLPQFQSVCWNTDTGAVMAEGFVVPCWWSGAEEDLGSGIDETMADAFRRLDGGEPVNALCALSAEVAPAARGPGLAAATLEQMRQVAARAGLTALIAPVRPSWKERYPIAPIEEYVTWRRSDGLLFDPWMRTHERLGARMGAALPRSLGITASVARWEQWLDLPLPASGAFTFPRGLAPLHVDIEADTARYWEPNVWFTHELPDR